MPITPGMDALRRGKRAIEESLDVVAEDLLAHSTAAAPFRTGQLRGSGEVGDVSSFEGNGGLEANVEVGFGAPYAAIVHEGVNVVEAPISMSVREYMRRPPGGARKTVRVRAHQRVLQAQVIHLNPPRIGKRKYLEDEMKAHWPRYEETIVRALKAGIESSD
jgi:hypothetical protein